MLTSLAIAAALAGGDPSPPARSPRSPPPSSPPVAPPAGAVGTDEMRCAVRVRGHGRLAVEGDTMRVQVRTWEDGAWGPATSSDQVLDRTALELTPWIRQGAYALCWTEVEHQTPRVVWMGVEHLTFAPPPRWETLVRGYGPHPAPADLVEVKLKGLTSAGVAVPTAVFGGPVGAMHASELGRLWPGLDDAARHLRLGGTTRLWPRVSSYGVASVDVSVIDHAQAPRAPSSVGRPPPQAAPLSGGAWWLLVSSDPAVDPPIQAYDRVCVHATAWSAHQTLRWDVTTDDGACLVPAQGAPAELPEAVAASLPGLERGDTVRLWTRGAQGPELWQVSVDTITRGVPPPPDVAGPPPDATVTASGLAYKMLHRGSGGPHPPPGARVTVRYTGWTTDGVSFESSGVESRSFGMNSVMSGWTEGLQLLSAGDRVRLWIPEALAYRGRPGKPAGTLVFDLELVSFHAPRAVTPPVAAVPPPPQGVAAPPADVAAPPADAIVTASGLAYKRLVAGTGVTHPGPRSRVTVHYVGWTSDGATLDSSYARNRPATFPLNGLIAGWTEGVQLMVQGDRFRFWIPEALAYRGQPGRPAGMLVYEIELLSIAD